MEWIHGTIDYGVMGILLCLSVVALSVAIERYLVLRVIQPEDFADKKTLELHLSRKLHLIATIGTNAPYIGLLGTVLGIMFIFSNIGQTGFDTVGIMTGLALALKSTAMGLFVAIPSVTLYNLLLRKCKVLLMQWEIANGRKGI